MTVTVRSFAKINLGLCIGALRPDGFHDLRTVYQTIALHDIIRVQVGRGTGIEIRCDDPRVPKDQSNTCYRIAERAMAALRGPRTRDHHDREAIAGAGRAWGGLGECRGHAAGARTGVEEEIAGRREAADCGRGRLGPAVFLVGGTVLGVGRGEEVYPLPDLPSACAAWWLRRRLGFRLPKGRLRIGTRLQPGAAKRRLPSCARLGRTRASAPTRIVPN